MTIYIQDDEGNWKSLEIKETELLKYQNLGWTADKPATLGLGSDDDDDGKKGADIVLSEQDYSDAQTPYGYPSLIKTGVDDEGNPILVDSTVYLNGLNQNGAWYYPGDEDVVLDSLGVDDLETLQTRLEKVGWLSKADYAFEFGTPGQKTRSALVKAMTASNYSTGIGYDNAINLNLLNPTQPAYEPKAYQPSSKSLRLQKVDAIGKAAGINFSNKERNYYEKILQNLEEKEFYTDEDITRIGIEGPKVEEVTTAGKPIVEFDKEGMVNIVGREAGTTKTVTEETPALFDAEAELAERVRGDFAGVLGRQQDVGVARMNAGNIAQSVMRLKGLGG
tara:strand:- start:790 stop:1794 length:1005 start_codon:yes stop_codon:yes gene_type:complete